MRTSLRAIGWIVLVLAQRLAMIVIVLGALALLAWTAAAALGFAPWLETTVVMGDFQYTDAGMYLQIAACVLALALLVYLPANRRILALETSHRRFHMTMGDVAKAYAVAHAEDRKGLFHASAEFDSIRERIDFLRRHPDLEQLEGPVIEAASQMSHVSRELAQTYSDRNVSRARDFLVQRQQDIADFEQRLEKAKVMADDLARWTREVEMEESIAKSRLATLRETLAELLPALRIVEEAEAEAEAEIAAAEQTAPEPAMSGEERAAAAREQALKRARQRKFTEKLRAAYTLPEDTLDLSDLDKEEKERTSNIVALLSARATRPN